MFQSKTYGNYTQPSLNIINYLERLSALENTTQNLRDDSNIKPCSADDSKITPYSAD